MHHAPGRSVVDALGNGLGYTWVLLLVGGIRELLGAGSLLGYSILPLREDGGWFEPVALMLRPPSAFFLIGFLIWILRSGATAPAGVTSTRTSAPPGALTREATP